MVDVTIGKPGEGRTYLRSTLQLAYKNIRQPFIMAHRHRIHLTLSIPSSGLDLQAWGHIVKTVLETQNSDLDG